MKSIVVYDSNFGNTKLIADVIAEELKTEAIAADHVLPGTLEGIELLVVGSPINGWRPTVKTLEFLKKLVAIQPKHLKAAAFDTRMKVFYSGNAARKISKLLKAAGAEVVLMPEGFYVKGKEGPLVDGEIERARNWALVLRLKALVKTKEPI